MSCSNTVPRNRKVEREKEGAGRRVENVGNSRGKGVLLGEPGKAVYRGRYAKWVVRWASKVRNKSNGVGMASA